MATAAAPRILLCADLPAAVAEMRPLLNEVGRIVDCHTFDAPEPEHVTSYDLIVLEGCRRSREALQLCRRLRSRLGEAFVPILIVLEDTAPSTRLASLDAGADTYLLRPFAPGELLGQVRAFLRLKQLHDRLAERTAEVHRINKRLQQAYQQIDLELELARRIQQSFLPQSLPETPPARFAVHYRPSGHVGGDFYDVFRLDEDHVGFYVADAMGHGVPASLLTIFIKKGVRAKEIIGRQYRLVPPDEVLRQLNRDLIDQELADTPFITMVYALFDCRDRTLRFARAGHPHPLYVPRDGEPEFWQVSGSLLGVFDTQFTVQSQRLQPGDKVLLYTDGLETAAAEDQSGADRLLDCAARHRELPVHEFVARLSHDLVEQSAGTDDLTLLGLEVRD
jgi:sigma-B regulation protein RsbU (phosphoserine phosphatase)